MSSTDGPKEAPEEGVDTEDVGGLGEVVPEPLVPVWRRIELIQAFRETHGPTYVKALELLVGLLLVAGYCYWLYLYFVVG